MNAAGNKSVVLHCIELYNKCTNEWLDTCYSKNMEWIEFSNPSAPGMRKGNFDFFRKFAEQALTLFPDRKLTVLQCLSENDCVVLELEWQGTFSASAGSHSAGDTARLRVASFFTLDNGLIIRQIDYCAPAI
jgi:ketosteroid isomerase-like protein